MKNVLVRISADDRDITVFEEYKTLREYILLKGHNLRLGEFYDNATININSDNQFVIEDYSAIHDYKWSCEQLNVRNIISEIINYELSEINHKIIHKRFGKIEYNSYLSGYYVERVSNRYKTIFLPVQKYTIYHDTKHAFK